MASVPGMMEPCVDPAPSPGHIETGNKMSWTQIRQAVRKSHRTASSLLGRTPSSFTFNSSKPDEGPAKQRLYFLGVQPCHRDNTLLYTDLDMTSESSSNCQADIKPLLESLHTTSMTYGQLSKEEQLLRERKRVRSFGIMSYDNHEESGRFLFPACNSLFICEDPASTTGFSSPPLFPKEVDTCCNSSKLDPKMCPSNPKLVAFVGASDIWVTNMEAGTSKRLTFTHSDVDSCSLKGAGVPSFVVQEEFDRYTGYWWQPVTHKSKDGKEVYRLLYEEVDESEVQVLNIVSPQSDGSAVDEYRYPRAGSPNASSTLRLIEFSVDDNGNICDNHDLQLPDTLGSIFPWMEYLLRAGWTPDGKYAYVVMVDRLQKKLQVVLLSPECFWDLSHTYNGDNHMSVDYSTQLSANMHVIYEDTTDIWLHVHDLLHFFPQSSSHKISFIYASEKSGFLHLYHVTSSLEPHLEDSQSVGACKPISQETAVTEGDWAVDAKQLWVDNERKLVYFVGYKDSVLESHLYVLSLYQPSTVVRLTSPGYSHAISMNKSCSMFVSVYSNVTDAPACAVFKLLFIKNDQTVLTSKICTLLDSTMISDYQAPELFSYPGSHGFTMHGMVYKPHNFNPDKKYPAVVFVYAGPQVQLVSNAYKGMRFLRLHTLASLGYVVVVVDPRGSCHRGLRFESFIQHKLGQAEVEDQVEGLQWLAKKGGYIDLNRIAVHGWSYGGYIALMGLCQRPDVFKIAIAGAPVTSWELYDTGYTERYMGLPSSNIEGYAAGSVLKQVDKFPSEENRLLIIHGLIDENVHFYHTSALISALVKACKPYDLQVYPNERHGIRNLDSNEHYETILLSYLQKHL